MMGPSTFVMVIKAPEAILSGAVVPEMSQAKWRPGVLFKIGWVLRAPKGSNE